ncbi:MAG: hypothetical protein FJ405_18160, partial [Verrucomicrobia bacterium]|nr:hypothetical protein [Verrucomicrobiota bacterium]
MKPIVLLFAALTSALPLPAAVVINEIHANAEPNPVRAEFVELHNTGPTDISLGGWRFSEGIDFLFPPGTILPAGGYLAIAESLPGFREAFGRQSQAEVIAHWSFDETSGSTAADSTGRPNAAGKPKTAVATAGVTQDAEGRFGGSGIALDGAPGNYLTIPYLDELWSGSYTLAAWVRPADRGVNPILADHSNPQAFLFSVDTAAKMTHRGPAAMPATAAVWAGNGGTIVSNVWQHVAAVWDRDAQVGKIYLDGVLVFSTLVGKGPAELPLVQNARPWHIGRNQADTNTFKGGLDELWVVKGALPISSIRTLMNENRLVTTDIVDLADIVGGGDGSLPGSGARNGINPVTGAQVASYGSGDNIPTAPGAFQPVEHPMIDGVFVPDGTLVAAQTITTTGLSTIVRAGDNDPSPGFWYDGAGLLGDPTKVNSTSAHYLPRYLEDPFRHSILSGMTQKGITFDLDAIESSRNGRQVTGLTAVAADSRMQSGGSIAALVFLDGAEVYRQTNIAGGERIIDLPIPAQARFLTLVIANSDRNNASDHGFFADPFLHIDPLPASETGPPVMGPYAGSL